jgi:hypothetical protein
VSSALRELTQEWGPYAAVTLYLDRCQVDTPVGVVSAVWRHVAERRDHVGKVIDFGAGDGRFARASLYDCYTGYEIDIDRSHAFKLSRRATLIHRCAFEDVINDADLCIGNPPYVRNQDLPEGWRQRAAEVIRQRTGVAISGLANAWQYFALLALASTKRDGLVALVIPFEWVSRPSARALRTYVKRNGWTVAVYRLRDETFQGVLTTSSITIIDKRDSSGNWQYFEETHDAKYRALRSPSGTATGVLSYARRIDTQDERLCVRRGLSPGTQEVLTLTEGERVRSGLQVDVDVVPCVTSLRLVGTECPTLTRTVFQRVFRDAGMKCWLIRTDCVPSSSLRDYLKAIPKTKRDTRTCKLRDEWWKFPMPATPAIIVASGFRGRRPKAVFNAVGARAVGAVFGIYGLSDVRARQLVKHLSRIDLTGRVVSHSNGLRKIEPRQLHTLVVRFMSRQRSGVR